MNINYGGKRAVGPARKAIHPRLAIATALAGLAIGQWLIAIPRAQAQAQAPSQPAAPWAASTIAACKKEHDDYNARRRAFESLSDAYWELIGNKRGLRRIKAGSGRPLTRRDYMLMDPPVYSGPERPTCVYEKPPSPPVSPTPTPPSTLPQVRDFLAAAQKHYRFRPRRVSENGFKVAFANAALEAGLTGEQVVGVYALETGGIGPYARQSGIFITDQECRPTKPRGRPASTALGYAQLLAANSSVVLAANGNDFANKLIAQAKTASPARAAGLKRKAVMLRRMVRDIKRGLNKTASRNGWREYISYGKTARGKAVHSLNLDADVGPLLQVHKLLRIKQAAANKGFANIDAAQMELLNLVGYGRGIEMLSPLAGPVPSANFFSRDAYEANPVAKGQTARGLLDKIRAIISRQLTKCGSVEFSKVFRAAAKKQAAAR